MRRAKAARLNNGAAVTTSLDPDFTLRDPHGQSLAGEDQTYQAPLLETLWDLVRHGELDQAVKVCEEGGEPWRAASLMGGRRWNMSGLSRYATSPCANLSANDSLTGSAMEGNRTRALWKKSCRAIAKNVGSLITTHAADPVAYALFFRAQPLRCTHLGPAVPSSRVPVVGGPSLGPHHSPYREAPRSPVQRAGRLLAGRGPAPWP